MERSFAEELMHVTVTTTQGDDVGSHTRTQRSHTVTGTCFGDGNGRREKALLLVRVRVRDWMAGVRMMSLTGKRVGKARLVVGDLSGGLRLLPGGRVAQTTYSEDVCET